MNALKTFARLFVGVVFIFSGFVKGIDPLGFTYKLTDYFNFFGAEWATKVAFILSVTLALLEFAVGVALTFNYRMRIFSWLALLFMAFFTPFTLFIAIKNPVTDCGCFGDALVITNWETFYKNIVLSLFAVLIFLYRKKFVNKYNRHFQNSYFIFFLLIFGFTTFYSYNHLPIIDFRPFKVGNNINDGMKIPPGAPIDEYKSTFQYKNKIDGTIKTFVEPDYPWNDTIHWQYVSMETKLIKKGYVPPIHGFTIEDQDRQNHADFFLNDDTNTFMLIAYNLSKSNIKKQAEINAFAELVKSKNMNFICITASSQEDIEKFKQTHNATYDFFNCDEIALKTIIRSNPGLMLTKKGTVLDKWHWRDFPTYDKLVKQKLIIEK